MYPPGCSTHGHEPGLYHVTKVEERIAACYEPEHDGQGAAGVDDQTQQDSEYVVAQLRRRLLQVLNTYNLARYQRHDADW